MILIGGTSLTREQLPFGDIIDYNIETNKRTLDIKLKAIARSDKCLAIFVSNKLSSEVNIIGLEEKVILFENDDHLYGLLDNNRIVEEVKNEILEEETSATVHNLEMLEEDTEYSEDESEKEEETKELYEEEMEEDMREVELNRVDINSVKPTGIDWSNIEEAETEVPKGLLEIPVVGTDTDIMKHELERTERILNQKNTEIEELNNQIDEFYKLQDQKLEELNDKHNKKIDEANEIIENLKNIIETKCVPEELEWLLPFGLYALNPKGVSNGSFTDSDLNKIKKGSSQIYTLACGSGDSIYSMLKHVREFMNDSTGAFIVDFTGDYYMNSVYKIQSGVSSLSLVEDPLTITDLTKTIKKSIYIPTTFYNDISLLSLDWVKLITRVQGYAKGKPIIFLLNNITSFPVRYTASLLSKVSKLYIFAKSNPLILSTLYGDISFISGGVEVLVSDYIEAVNPIIQQIGQKVKVIPFKEECPWDKIFVK